METTTKYADTIRQLTNASYSRMHRTLTDSARSTIRRAAEGARRQCTLYFGAHEKSIADSIFQNLKSEGFSVRKSGKGIAKISW